MENIRGRAGLQEHTMSTYEPSFPIYVYGAGGHGLVLAEAAEAAGTEVVGFIDESPPVTSMGKWSVRTSPSVDGKARGVIVAIGDNMARRRIASDIVQTGLQLVTIIHPTAYVSPSAIVGQGVYIGAGAVVNGQSQIQNGSLINTGAIVEHHCVVGAYSHVGPGAIMAGGVWLGSLSLLGAGSVVKPEVRIGDDCTIAAGADVAADIPVGRTAAGVPAELID